MRYAEAAVERLRLAARRGGARHAHLEAAVQAQLEGVHEGGDDEQAAAVVGGGIGVAGGVEAAGVEAAATVPDLSGQAFGFEGQRDLDVVAGAAMADGVGAGLLDAEHAVVDDLVVGAVLAQVVAQAFASAQQVGGFGGNAEAEPRWQIA